MGHRISKHFPNKKACLFVQQIKKPGTLYYITAEIICLFFFFNFVNVRETTWTSTIFRTSTAERRGLVRWMYVLNYWYMHSVQCKQQAKCEFVHSFLISRRIYVYEIHKIAQSCQSSDERNIIMSTQFKQQREIPITFHKDCFLALRTDSPTCVSFCSIS